MGRWVSQEERGSPSVCVMSNFQAFSSHCLLRSLLCETIPDKFYKNARLKYNFSGQTWCHRKKMSYVTPPFCSLLRKSSGTERDICMILLFAEMRQIVRETCSTITCKSAFNWGNYQGLDRGCRGAVANSPPACARKPTALAQVPPAFSVFCFSLSNDSYSCNQQILA